MATPAIPPLPQLADCRLKDLLSTDLGLSDVFYRHGLDFCCHGQQTLAHAVEGAHVSLKAVISDIEQHRLMGSQRLLGVEEWPVAFLVEYIERVHHVFTRHLLADLTPALARVLQKHGATYPQINQIADLYAALVAELQPHMLKEEQVLFAYIRNRPSPLLPETVPAPIRVMMAEHDVAGGLLYQLADITHQFTPPPNACQTTQFVYRKLRELDEDLRVHIHLENNLLFPRVLAAAAADWPPNR